MLLLLMMNDDDDDDDVDDDDADGDAESDNVEDGQASSRLLRAAGQQEGDYFHRRRQHARVRGVRRAAAARTHAPVPRPQILVRSLLQ